MASGKAKSTRRRAKPRASAHPLPFRPRPDLLKNPFLDETIAFWQPRSERALNREDAREIVENLTGFFELLREWEEDDRKLANSLIEPSDAAEKNSIAADS
jgi:hypothetical protein